MTRRTRRYRTAVIAAVAGLVIWRAVHEPQSWAGLGLIITGCLVIWPLLFLAVVFLLPACLAAAVPRQWRASYRKRRKLKGKSRSDPIRARLRQAVLTADRYRCVYCGSPVKIQVDHCMPYALGGMATLFNLMLLCAVHNKIKSDYWIDKRGYVNYHPWAGYNDVTQAAAILAAERRHRWNLLRWLRAAQVLR